MVRLRITDPEPSFDQPVIRYFIGPAAGSGTPTVRIALLVPATQRMLVVDTVFAWAPIVGARAYQIEFYDTPSAAQPASPSTAPIPQPNAMPVTGMLVSGNDTKIKLSSTALTHLVSGHRYMWRVIAIGADGAVIGGSEARALTMP